MNSNNPFLGYTFQAERLKQNYGLSAISLFLLFQPELSFVSCTEQILVFGKKMHWAV
jgi:hypothetical protein